MHNQLNPLILKGQEYGHRTDKVGQIDVKVVAKSTGVHYRWGNNCNGWHLVKSRGLSIILEWVPGGGAETRHFHQHAEQFFFVLSGKAIIDQNSLICSIPF